MSNEGQDNSAPIPSSSELNLGVRIDRICSEFEELLKAGQSPRIETYLPQLPPEHQRELLEELLGLELDYRAKAGDSFTSEEYTLRFPEHASEVAELVVSVRQETPTEARKDQAKPRQMPPAKNASSSSQSTQRSNPSHHLVKIGPYEILEPCGRGGMGVVYKAWHEFFKQYRAIKVLPSNFDEDDISRFAQEIENTGRLNHPNIVRAHEANREHGILYLVMEYVDGINLDHLVKHHSKLPLGLACEMVRQAAEGLQHAHDHFLVHRDIKPSNLMVNQQGQVKILDFGLARLHAEQNASRLTKHGSVMGTLDYMAPEQWEDPKSATIQADIYSLGCTLFYLVSGQPPYSGEAYSHWLKKQEAHRKAAVPKLNHEHAEKIQPIIDRMMAKSIAERFTTPSQIVEALKPLSDDEELKTYAKTPAPKISDSGIRTAPIPTVNVSNTEVLSGGILGQLQAMSSTEDSAVNSKEKTIRPGQSKTDLDSELRQAQPSKPRWYASRKSQLLVAVLSIMLLAGAWKIFGPAQNTALAVQMGALPGLNGGLNGDWWFAEMPWYGPGVRKALMEALRRGESEIAGVPLNDLPDRLAAADTESLQKDLKKIVAELKNRLPARELSWAGQIMIPKPGSPNYDKLLLNILPEIYSNSTPLNEETLNATSTTELHLVANVLHWIGSSDSNYDAKTEQAYTRVLATYDSDDPVESVLLAVAQSDFSRFLSSRKNYTRSLHLAESAAGSIPEAMLFHVSLRCDLADQYRKVDEDSQTALLKLRNAPDSAEVWANDMNLAADHPLRAEILERRAWVNVDGWQMAEAIADFKEATAIRQANQKEGNSFAWRPLLLSQQGEAMTRHYLGEDVLFDKQGNPILGGAISIYDDLIATIRMDNTSSGLPFGTKAERASRLPNVYERLGDAYLFGQIVDYMKAAENYDLAILESIKQDFADSPTFWFHLTRMDYKHALALALSLSNDMTLEEREHVRQKIEESLNAAQELEDRFRAKLSDDPSAYGKQQSLFALEQQVARAVYQLQLAEPANIGPELDSLQQLIESTQPSQVGRANIEVLLLVFQVLFKSDNASQLSKADLQKTATRLQSFTSAMREGDTAIRTQYLAPVFRAAAEVVEHPGLKKQLQAAVQVPAE